MSKKSLILLELLLVILIPSGESHCKAIPVDEFFERAVKGAPDFVVTIEKLGILDNNWSIREDVVFDSTNNPDLEGYLGSRGFEFLYDLTPENTDDYLQEIHTTISAFDHSREGKFVVSDYSFGCVEKSRIDYNPKDVENTVGIKFAVDNYQVTIKTKFIEYEEAIPILKQSAQIVITEITTE